MSNSANVFLKYTLISSVCPGPPPLLPPSRFLIDQTVFQKRKGGQAYAQIMIWLIAETMHAVENNRDYYKYGTHEAQPNLRTPFPQMPWKMKVIDALIAPFFFGSHILFRNRLYKAFQNRSENVPQIKTLFESLLLQWAGGLLSSVIYLQFNDCLIRFEFACSCFVYSSIAFTSDFASSTTSRPQC